MDTEKIAGINQKRIVTFVNQFLINSISFLNNLIAASDTRLAKCEEKIKRLNCVLTLLETKLNSVSVEYSDSDQVLNTNNNDETPAENTPNSEDQVSSQQDEPECFQDQNLSKFYKMLKFGVPVDAVKLKMVQEEIDPSLLKV